MYCYQCEQTAKGTGCNVLGVCGKDARTAALQDLLVYAAKGISMYAHRAAEMNVADPAVDRAVLEYLFATVTNVDFDPERLRRHLSTPRPCATRSRRSTKTPACKPARPPRFSLGPLPGSRPPISTDWFARATSLR